MTCWLGHKPDRVDLSEGRPGNVQARGTVSGAEPRTYSGQGYLLGALNVDGGEAVADRSGQKRLWPTGPRIAAPELSSRHGANIGQEQGIYPRPERRPPTHPEALFTKRRACPV